MDGRFLPGASYAWHAVKLLHAVVTYITTGGEDRGLARYIGRAAYDYRQRSDDGGRQLVVVGFVNVTEVIQQPYSDQVLPRPVR